VYFSVKKGRAKVIKFRLHKVAADRDILKIGEMAELAGLSPQTVSGLWNNNTLRVDLSTLNALCEALNCTPGDLLEYLPEASTKAKKRS
jgi:putative transcriptional regulator